MELSDATEKAPATPGIDPGTFRFVVQCLNHYVTPGPNSRIVLPTNAPIRIIVTAADCYTHEQYQDLELKQTQHQAD
jgi:hypothetical protein